MLVLVSRSALKQRCRGSLHVQRRGMRTHVACCAREQNARAQCTETLAAAFAPSGAHAGACKGACAHWHIRSRKRLMAHSFPQAVDGCPALAAHLRAVACSLHQRQDAAHSHLQRSTDHCQPAELKIIYSHDQTGA
eukprot:6182468-Pleurochrysis_carterae.AAC.1